MKLVVECFGDSVYMKEVDGTMALTLYRDPAQPDPKQRDAVGYTGPADKREMCLKIADALLEAI